MIKLNHASLHKMKLHSSRTYPEECCGVLLGRVDNETKVVCDILEMKNAKDENRSTRFLITPEDYKSAEQQAKQEGVDLVGSYHSHPDHPAVPSQFDLEHAMPWWSYVIINVEAGQPSTLRSWLMNEDRSRFEEEELIVVDGQFKHFVSNLLSRSMDF